ncbi:hypothetical protein EUTSA_v10019386mg [Eutrema salsugineum]|uniref:Uncharacterized protein n=1 Tax=Eutrema salsugineum TaxID=72664 RepID=V4KCB8_EUTSA|nr:hypothetical protein EUTSA_v10019386mg [Eutrema salsugineum]
MGFYNTLIKRFVFLQPFIKLLLLGLLSLLSFFFFFETTSANSLCSPCRFTTLLKSTKATSEESDSTPDDFFVSGIGGPLTFSSIFP